jgi:hypothetical protein
VRRRVDNDANGITVTVNTEAANVHFTLVHYSSATYIRLIFARYALVAPLTQLDERGAAGDDVAFADEN